jgi:hypothetical protein
MFEASSRRMHPKICNNYVTRSRLAVERVSMSAGDLSRRMRVMRGKHRMRLAMFLPVAE